MCEVVRFHLRCSLGRLSILRYNAPSLYRRRPTALEFPILFALLFELEIAVARADSQSLRVARIRENRAN